ncbi:hypothetical protein MLD38_025234 [Melastoma candidum]|uniref:Uncharacterized protein n=1 Tax=Melastoma candidum TaxID=119954 RepID=A0ACB9NUP3_9MYRT|nr:hypothetical protein MLD38_025234 [Melastoma candidum]
MFNPEFDTPDYSLSPSPFSSTPYLPLLAIPDQLGPRFVSGSTNEATKALIYLETPHKNSGSSSGGSCISSPSCRSNIVECGFMQRSCSTLSLLKDSGYSLPFGSTFEFADPEDTPVRRGRSTVDLDRIDGGSRKGQRSRGSQLMSESNAIIEGLSRTSRYSPVEKKERIERYRSKRTQRNFDKKIKYACRKTLADSRPRIRGRFARNNEIEKTEPQLPWGRLTEPGEEEEEEEEPHDYNNWVVGFLEDYALGTESN